MFTFTWDDVNRVKKTHLLRDKNFISKPVKSIKIH